MKPTLDQLTDWIRRIAGDDPRSAFRALFEAFYPELLRFALFYVRQKEVAEELVQDVFVKIWQRRHFLPGVQNLRSYLFTATRHHCLNHLQKAVVPLVSLDELPSETALKDNFHPENALLLEETRHVIQGAIDHLPPQCRLIFNLVREQGLSYREVAEVLELSPRTVESQMGIALKKLAAALRPEGAFRKN
ncbi:MAG: RNA polymerase sigma-70 factor [Sphingobacteriaceae bacterium]|nr:RNA polymerase sigma-70 factor [Cytophagaceae bacterium]